MEPDQIKRMNYAEQQAESLYNFIVRNPEKYAEDIEVPEEFFEHTVKVLFNKELTDTEKIRNLVRTVEILIDEHAQDESTKLYEHIVSR